MGMIKTAKREWKIPKPPGSPSSPLEKDVMSDCRVLLKSYEPGIWWQRMEGSGKMIRPGVFAKSEMSGTPDLMIILPNSKGFRWAEVKRAGLGTLSQDQAEFIFAVNSRFGSIVSAAVVCSATGLEAFLSGQSPHCWIAEEFNVPVFF